MGFLPYPLNPPSPLLARGKRVRNTTVLMYIYAMNNTPNIYPLPLLVEDIKTLRTKAYRGGGMIV